MKKYYFAILGVFILFFTIGSGNTSAKMTFKDVNNQYWAKEQINYLAEKNIVGGYPDGTFKPNDQLTRVQAAKMLVKALKLPTIDRPETVFEDIPKGHQAYSAIATISGQGLMGGTNGFFRPDETLTRAQMAAILTKAFELKEGPTYNIFKDVSQKHWAYEQVNLISSNRITGGYSDNTFRPNHPTTRAQFSVFLAVTLYPDLFQSMDPDKVTREANGDVTSYGSWIYYTSSSQDGINLFREKMDGSNKVKLAEKVHSFDIENNSIYYFSGTEVKRMDLDGKNKQKIEVPSEMFSYIEVEGDLLYSSKRDYCGWNGDDYFEGEDRNRVNLKTLESIMIDSCGRGPFDYFISDKGINSRDGFYPADSTKPQELNFVNKSLISEKFNYYNI